MIKHYKTNRVKRANNKKTKSIKKTKSNKKVKRVKSGGGLNNINHIEQQITIKQGQISSTKNNKIKHQLTHELRELESKLQNLESKYGGGSSNKHLKAQLKAQLETLEQQRDLLQERVRPDKGHYESEKTIELMKMQIDNYDQHIQHLKQQLSQQGGYTPPHIIQNRIDDLEQQLHENNDKQKQSQIKDKISKLKKQLNESKSRMRYENNNNTLMKGGRRKTSSKQKIHQGGFSWRKKSHNNNKSFDNLNITYENVAIASSKIYTPQRYNKYTEYDEKLMIRNLIDSMSQNEQVEISENAVTKLGSIGSDIIMRISKSKSIADKFKNDINNMLTQQNIKEIYDKYETLLTQIKTNFDYAQPPSQYHKHKQQSKRNFLGTYH